MTSQINTSILDFNMYNSYTEVTISHKVVNKNPKNMAVTLSRPTHILYECANFGDDRTSILTCATSNMSNAYTHISIFLASKVCPMLKYSDIHYTLLSTYSR